MKIYLIRELYKDEYYNEILEGDLVCIASTAKKANAMVYFLKEDNEKRDYQIEEWEVDDINPVGDAGTQKIFSLGEIFKRSGVRPYKIIKYIGKEGY